MSSADEGGAGFVHALQRVTSAAPAAGTTVQAGALLCLRRIFRTSTSESSTRGCCPVGRLPSYLDWKVAELSWWHRSVSALLCLANRKATVQRQSNGQRSRWRECGNGRIKTGRAEGAGEPGEAAEGNGVAGKVHLSRTRQKKWAKIDPLSSFSSCPRISQSGEGGRAARWAARWPDPGRPSARPGRPFGPPFGPPLFLKGGPRRPGRPGGHQGGRAALRAALRPSGRPVGRAT